MDTTSATEELLKLAATTGKPADETEDTSDPPGAPTAGWSLAVLLPVAMCAAFIGNIVVFSAFSSDTLKRFRSSVYVRYTALAEILSAALATSSYVIYLVSPKVTYSRASKGDCRMFTGLLFALQDMSMWGLMLFLCERFGALFAPHLSSCLTFDLSVGKMQFRVRHIHTICGLWMLTILLLSGNAYIAEETAKTEDPNVELGNALHCISTWKSPADFSFHSMSMIHMMVGKAVPALFFLMVFVVLRNLYNALHGTRSVDGQAENNDIPLVNLNGRVEGDVVVPPSPDMAPGPNRNILLPEAQASKFMRFQTAFRNLWRACKPIFHFYEETPSYSVPPNDVDKSLHAMARAHALFFFFIHLPQIVFTFTAYELVKSKENWFLLSNIGVGLDVLLNGKGAVMMFVYIRSGGEVFRKASFSMLKLVVANCRRCFDPIIDASYERSINAARQRQGRRQNQAQDQRQNQGPRQDQGQGRVPHQYRNVAFENDDGRVGEGEPGRGGQGQNGNQGQGQGQGQGQNAGGNERHEERPPAAQRSGDRQGQGRGGRGRRSRRRELNVLPFC